MNTATYTIMDNIALYYIMISLGLIGGQTVNIFLFKLEQLPRVFKTEDKSWVPTDNSEVCSL